MLRPIMAHHVHQMDIHQILILGDDKIFNKYVSKYLATYKGEGLTGCKNYLRFDLLAEALDNNCITSAGILLNYWLKVSSELMWFDPALYIKKIPRYNMLTLEKDSRERNYKSESLTFFNKKLALFLNHPQQLIS